ncbi:hypothetical protein BO83DRAFT_4899 [Aspergillus eucalypticola CBS 122712]|uniref:Uncharacterized protein n=1 Tax=Aspergillus eucalypticola (strain CBS 122712 / IBT 29274) TaxID=1448314 RepID=A0A317WGA0_ASPEC|nr:uncharacterized protein BO83DRAFT_4899 [Aspergillus eucalypticola CBS 122712]PWY85319.1 hypothetical protein BO83DRAFT_4899 [Aspergillus eucalypticola CBS 122712]
MRNSEESSPYAPAIWKMIHFLNGRYCPQGPGVTSLHTPAIGIRNIGGGRRRDVRVRSCISFPFLFFPMGESLRRLCVHSATFDRVCDTLVQYAACRFLFPPRCSPPLWGVGWRGRMGLVSFDSDYSGGGGASLLFSEVSWIPYLMKSCVFAVRELERTLFSPG